MYVSYLEPIVSTVWLHRWQYTQYEGSRRSIEEEEEENRDEEDKVEQVEKTVDDAKLRLLEDNAYSRVAGLLLIPQRVEGFALTQKFELDWK